MSARILVVDDIEVNRRLLEVRLRAEYFDVVQAGDGQTAIEICRTQPVDLVLLDVMMPDLDGNAVCRVLKGDPATRHIPVVLVTALDQPADRVRGLEAGADDFLTKPVRDLPLFSRIRSLVRLKMLTDELRVRTQAAHDVMMAIPSDAPELTGRDGTVILAMDRPAEAEKVARVLRGEHQVRVGDSDAAVSLASAGDAELMIVDLDARTFDPLRLCSALRSCEAARQLPILLVASEEDEARIAKAFEIGASDYVRRPIDPNELQARARTQIRRRRQDETLRRNLRQTIELATVDPLTGLYNRRFLESHLASTLRNARTSGKAVALLVADIDHFKRINDTHGHDGGDAVLRQFAGTLKDSLRASDTACRTGGEEFVVVMPDADEGVARAVGERIRLNTQSGAFAVDGGTLAVTVSVGYAVLREDDDGARLMKRADLGLYAAKENGRNRVEAVSRHRER